MVSTKEKGSSRKGERNRGKAEPAGANAAHDVDALFQLPLSEFTSARNALAARLKKSGRASEAEEVKALAKPSIAAWAANQLYWRHRKAFNELLETGERFRVAQVAQLSGKSADLRSALEARRTALSELSRLAAGILERGDNNPAPDVMRRITTTLEAVSTYASLPGAPQPGHLTADVDPPGFETLAALVPQVGGAGRTGGDVTRVLPFKQGKAAHAKRRHLNPEEEARRVAEEKKAQLAAAKRLLTESERALVAARKNAEQAESRLKAAAARANEADKERAAAEKRFEKATADADAARQQARHVAEEAEEAAQTVEDAERALEQATKSLNDLQ